MGKSSGSSSQPQAPNPAAVANAQGAANVDTAVANAWLNAQNQATPWGNVQTKQTGSHTVGKIDVPTFGQTITLSPEQQHLYEQGVLGDTKLNDLGLAQIGRIQNAVSSPFQLSDYGTQPVADAAYRQQQQDALQARLNPQLDRAQAQLEQRLANQGISMGSQAWQTAMDQEARNRNDANLGVIAQSGNEEAQQYGLESGSYQQRLANALLQRQQPLQEYAQFTGASNNFQSPQGLGQAQSMIQPTDIAGPQYASYNAQQQQAQQGQNQQNALLGAGAGLAGSVLGGWASTW